jgi:hypothetical protein
MTNTVMDVVLNLSPTVRIGWAAWMAWGLLQWGWYRHAGTVSAEDAAMAMSSEEQAADTQMLSLRPFLQSPDA